MQKADLHVHSKYSSNPADMVLKKFGTQESYTEIEEVYRQAKERGMSLVTVTDHNTAEGSFRLLEQYPAEAFTGVELTTCFPEDGCAIHLLVYDFTREQFAELDRLRTDIYQLRDYIKKEGLPYSVAHATYGVNGRLSLAAIEKLILLFDIFECINGTRVEAYNGLLKKVLEGLTQEKIDELRRKHSIAPMSANPWVKAFTGGSDEHAGLFIGATYTTSEGDSKDDFLRALREKRTDSGGRSNHYKTQVYTFLRIAYQNSVSKKSARGSLAKRAFDEICGAIFDGKGLNWKTQLKIEQLKRSRKEKTRLIASQVGSMVRRLVNTPDLPHEEKIDLIYETMAGLEDEFFISNFEAFREGFAKGDVVKLLSSLTAVFRSFFLSLPFLGTFRHLHQSSSIMEELRREFLGPLKREERRILWFTDTLFDMNGVAVTLNDYAVEAAKRGLWVRMATSRQVGAPAASWRVDLPVVYEYAPAFYPDYSLRFPSLLKSLEIIYAQSPTQIMVSTPGPVGLLGILASRLFGIPCRGIYHSDFTRMAELGLSGGSLASMVQGYIHWFYGCMDKVLVPTKETMNMLVLRGYEPSKLGLFSRGIDTARFCPREDGRSALRRARGLRDSFTLLFVGRLSKDKSVTFLADIYRELKRKNADVQLVLAGDGPELSALKEMFKGDGRVFFLGRVKREALSEIYALADLLVFPSTMDTFGMAVLEAQACGLPALVTNIGGPQEVIIPGKTGEVLPSADKNAWVEAILRYRNLAVKQPARYQALRSQARTHISERFSWDQALSAFLS